MDAPAIIQQKLHELGAELGLDLQLTRYWENDFRSGWYCRFRGSVLRTESLVIEVAGSQRRSYSWRSLEKVLEVFEVPRPRITEKKTRQLVLDHAC